ncbi:MAG: hypothetical protein RL021_789 [Bacteroidota bacterium]|jgi:nitrogen fixation protein FixH
MRINWGFGIALTALGFVAFMLSLVYRCSREEVDLVSEKYYENELRYQERIDRMRNSADSGRKVSVTQQNSAVRLVFPESVNGAKVGGDIAFYRPDNSRLDFNLPLSLDATSSQVIPVAGKQRGRWQLQITWESGGVPYYQEEEIWIN